MRSRPPSRAATPIRASRRRSTSAATGKRSVRALLAANANVIAYVAGHTHVNHVEFVGGRRGGGFWQINTASHIDWPQQSRLIQVMDNRDGTLSIFGTMLDSAAPEAAPAPGDALGLSPGQLVSLSRDALLQRPAARGRRGLRRRGGQDGQRERPQRRAARARSAVAPGASA